MKLSILVLSLSTLVLAQFKANDNECIDDTRFRKYTSATDFIIQSCPTGMCFTRSPPVKNPCVGKDNAIRIDGKASVSGTGNGNTGSSSENPPANNTPTSSPASPTPDATGNEAPAARQFKANEMECIDDTQFRLYTSPTTFTIQRCPPGFCFTRNPPFKNPCVGRDNAIRIDNKGAASASNTGGNNSNPPPAPNSPPPAPNTPSEAPASTGQFKANEMECIDDTQFRLYTSPTTFTIQRCPPGFCFTRNPPFKNPCVGRDNAIRIDNKPKLKKRSPAPMMARNRWV